MLLTRRGSSPRPVMATGVSTTEWRDHFSVARIDGEEGGVKFGDDDDRDDDDDEDEEDDDDEDEENDEDDARFVTARVDLISMGHSDRASPQVASSVLWTNCDQSSGDDVVDDDNLECSSAPAPVPLLSEVERGRRDFCCPVEIKHLT
jgi:hypothetical protein